MPDRTIRTLFRYGRHGIFARLLLVALIIAVLSGVGRQLFLQILLSRDVGKLAATQQMSTATYIARDIDEKIRLRLSLLRAWHDELPAEVLARPEALRLWLQAHQSGRVLFTAGLVLFDADGEVVAAQSDRQTDPAQIRASDWFRQAIAGDQPVIGQPAKFPGLDGEPVVTMAIALADPSGRRRAVLAGMTALSADNFLNLLQREKIGETGGVLLIDPRANIIIAGSNRSATLVPAAPPGVNPLHDRARAGFRGTGETNSAGNVPVLSAIASVVSPDWFIVVYQSVAEAYRPLTHVQEAIIGFGLVMLLMVMLVLFVTLPRLLGPLTEAARQLHAMAQGEQEIGPLPLVSKDEIGAMVTGFNFLLRKLREKERALLDNEARMSHIAHHDALTGLPNRMLFEDRLAQLLLQAERNELSFALLYVDLDGFKPINDRYGHRSGDAVLCEVGLRLTALLRKGDTVARIGGDEFVILLPDLTDSASDPRLVAEKCREMVRLPILHEGVELKVDCSIGIARFPEDGLSLDQLLSRADEDMYQVKRARRPASELRS